MDKEMKNKLTTVFGGGLDGATEQFLSILEAPDDQFDMIYASIKDKMDSIFSSKKFQQEVLAQLEMSPLEDISTAKNQVEEFIKEIQADNSLSKNKKEFLSTLIKKSVMEVYELYENRREKIEVKIVRIHPDAKLPDYAHSTDAGCDVYAIEDVTLKPHTTQIIKTGLTVAIPSGYEIQVRMRSGLALKSTLRLANSIGTIDSQYRGEIGIIMENNGNLSYTIHKGDKIAQLVISPVPMIKWNEVKELDTTERGTGGYGSTDKK